MGERLLFLKIEDLDCFLDIAGDMGADAPMVPAYPEKQFDLYFENCYLVHVPDLGGWFLCSLIS